MMGGSTSNERMDKKRWKSMMGGSTSNELPEILIMDILSRLPVKSLLRFNRTRTVSPRHPCRCFPLKGNKKNYKAKWKKISIYLTLSMVFLSESPIHATDCFVCKNIIIPQNRRLGILGPQLSFGILVPDKLRIFLNSPSHRPFDCTGSEHEAYEYFIRNDADTHYEYNGFRCDIYFHFIGFGFDRKSNDYKVIVFVTFTLGDEHGHELVSRPQAHLYSLSRNSWEEIDPPNFDPSGNKASTYIDGICYWGVSNDRVGNFILSFNMVEQVYSEISLPDSISKYSEVHITSINELVAAIHVLPGEEIYEQSFDLWVLMDGCSCSSWIKKFKIGPIVGVRRPFFWKNDVLCSC
ncbi:hypothetical protein CCACVL1_01517 [Corchorus capsularis]|uniref:F-box associated beta-propeller type 1 domain-containing protein n=1 Tax=Corchorus capsularis TaxID=210143 RepID=A0A1R3KHH2_COCAP|nr:hypothetical protein CCACVL1_01517 [Corchorus capsularis]